MLKNNLASGHPARQGSVLKIGSKIEWQLLWNFYLTRLVAYKFEHHKFYAILKSIKNTFSANDTDDDPKFIDIVVLGLCHNITSSATTLGDLLHFGQLFKASGNIFSPNRLYF